MPGVVTNKKNLYLGKCLDDLHKLSEIKPLVSNVNIIVRSADKVFRDAEKLDGDGDEERALVMYMKYFNILKQVKTRADYKKQKEYFDNLIGRKNQYQAIDRAEKLTESLKDRYDFQKAESLAKKLPSVDSVPVKKEPKSTEVSTDNNENEKTVKTESEEKEPKQSSVTCMQLCDLLRDSGTKLILMDIRPGPDYTQSHISHSECISIPHEIIVPGSTVSHIEAKLTNESKVVWKTRKNADHIILLDWRSKMDDVKVGTPIQTLKDALYKFDTSVFIKSEPLLLEGGYENWLVFYPTLTTNPHVAVPDKDGDKDKAPSPTLLLDFDYPELDENLQKKVKEPPIQNNTLTDNGAIPVNSAVPKVDRSLKPSISNMSVNAVPESAKQNSQDVIINNSLIPKASANNMYPSVSELKGMNGLSSQMNRNLTDTPVSSKIGPKPINLSIKNNLSTDGPKSDVNNHVVMKNDKVQEGNDRMEEVERKLRELELLKKKKERDVADLMRKERKIKEELKSEKLKREEDQRLLALEEEKRKAAQEQAEKEEGQREKRIVDVEKMRMERKKQEEEEKEEMQKLKEEQEDRLMKEEMERKEKELQRLEEMKRIEQEEEEKIAKEMQELEKAKAERLKKGELKRIEEEKRIEAERQKERMDAAKREEEERKRQALVKLEEEKRSKENAEKRRLLEMKNKEKNAMDQRSEKTVPVTNLPTGWEKRLHKDTNRYYYIDHNRGVTTWVAPTGVTTPAEPNNDTYTTKLKDEPTLSRSLSRSHSSPNIMKELAEEEKALSKKPVLVVDRTSKPVANTSNKIVQPVYTMRKRDLNPTYGNVIQGLTGLRNLGNTCYMNSTIQCLNNTSPLITYFLSDNYHRDINRESSQGMHGEVVDDFSVVIKALWSGQYRSITPRDLKFTIGKYNAMFAGFQQQDSQEFLTFLLDGLHEGLNEVKNAPEIPEQNNDRLSDEKAAKLAWEHHKLLHRSIIVELFQGQLKSTLMCRTCMKTSVTFQAFMFLSLPIPASSRCTLKDCIQEFLKPEMMTGSCKWKCPECKVERDSEKKIDIWRLPPILLVGLNRFYSEGMWIQKKTTYVDFPVTDVDFSPYILGIEPRNRYNLYGISNHYGTMEGGHYTAFCRNPVTTKWYKFDDQEVSDISKSNIKTSAAFVLYYTSIEMSAPQYRI